MVGFNFIQFYTFGFFVIYLTYMYSLRFLTLRFFDKPLYIYVIGSYTVLLQATKTEYLYTFGIQLLTVLTFKYFGKIHEGYFIFYKFIILYLVLALMIFFLLLRKQFSNKELQVIWKTSMFLFIGVMCLFCISNLLLLIFALELIGVSYYFFFIYCTLKSYISFIKFKNLISSYLWFSFIVLLLLGGSVFSLLVFFGTTEFLELCCTSSIEDYFIIWAVLFIGIFWKVGAPGFHFFKLELYQYLPAYTVIFFTMMTLFINFYVVVYVLIYFKPMFLLNYYEFSFIILLFNIALLFRGSLNDTVYRFLAYSSVNTWTFLIMFTLL